MKKKMMLAAVAATMFCGSAQASVITFDGLGGVNGAPFTSYTENGFTVTATSGSVFDAFAYGNPTPDIYLNEASSVSVTRLGATFNFASVDLSSSSSAPGSLSNYVLQGFAGATQLFSQSGGAPGGAGNTFVTVANASTASMIDRLVISYTTGNSSLNIDNIAFSDPASGAVPEPASWAMMISGFGMVGAGMRYRRQRTTLRLA